MVLKAKGPKDVAKIEAENAKLDAILLKEAQADQERKDKERLELEK